MCAELPDGHGASPQASQTELGSQPAPSACVDLGALGERMKEILQAFEGEEQPGYSGSFGRVLP